VFAHAAECTIWYINAKQKLLDAAVAYAEEYGTRDLTLRELAAAIGTSHRMLLYHFGSKEGLFAAIVDAVEAREREYLTALLSDIESSPAATIRAMWRHLADPARWAQERLFFEVYAQTLDERFVTAWLAIDGSPQARLGLAVVRGLLLDLIATGDQDGVDEAIEHYISLLSAYVPGGVRGAAS
jgi:AcrR family transcriptional regulator